MTKLRKQLNDAARAILEVQGVAVTPNHDFMNSDNPKGRVAWAQACAAYEVFFGDSPDPAELEEDDQGETARTATEWAEEMAKLRDRKPRPLHKRFGKNPTEAQIAEHREAERAWNRDYRHASKMQKKTLAEENAARLT